MSLARSLDCFCRVRTLPKTVKRHSSSEHAMQGWLCSKWVGLFRGRGEVHLLKRQLM